jgi:hypothetical protein
MSGNSRQLWQRTEDATEKNAAAIALLDEWYATPDDRPPGYWDARLHEIETHRLHFREDSAPSVSAEIFCAECLVT